ncbi:MAG: DUF2075 domain-containing protein [Actinobacteria bacterium]|nr:MAG: DUF2075 domain-containing protein [Actinomycetota bacterium]
MSAFRVSAASLLRLAENGTLVDRVDEHVRMSGSGVGPGERVSWSRSLAGFAHDLSDAGLAGVEVIVEYKLPLTSKRADVVLAGRHPRTGADSYVVVELKQWSRAWSFEGLSTLVSVEHVAGPRLHPGVQVSGYCEYLADFLGVAAQAPGLIRGAAYLHNASDDGVRDLLAVPATEHSRLFTSQRRGEFLDFLCGVLSPEPGAAAADRFLASSVRPSQHLLTYAADIMRQRAHFTLLDEQRVAYELVLHAVERARDEDGKSVVVVTGGPGSGKSVIALTMLGEMARQGYPVLHATGSRSFTQTLRRYAGRGSTRTQNLFKYFNNFVDARRNGIEVLVCDEAHRIRETSANRYTRREVRERSRPQVDELISAARVPVFLLDEHQVVRPGETGTVDVIRNHANRLGLTVDIVSLHGQFRCGGSKEYEQWVVRLLGLGSEGPLVWQGDGFVDLRLAGSPEEMEAFLAGRQADGETARLSAGFCWPWSDPRADGSLVPDVQIGSWSRPWNVKSDRSIGEAPGSSYWATDPAGFGQVGCVYTAQGFEYEWSGVIIGPDLVARDGQLVARRDQSRDPALKGKATSDAAADRLIRNTYKVLLTRGMRGTMIYSADAETRAYLSGLVHPVRGLETRYERIAPGVYERREP